MLLSGGKVPVKERILGHIVQAADTDRQVIGFQRLLAQGCDLAGGRVAGYGDEGMGAVAVFLTGLSRPGAW